MKTWIVMLLLIISAQADADDSIAVVSSMCVATYQIAASHEDNFQLRSFYESQAEWFKPMTTPADISAALGPLTVALASDRERVWPLIQEALTECNRLILDVEDIEHD